VSGGGLTGTARRFTGCSPGGAAWDEVALPLKGGWTVYLQVKAATAQDLPTETVLAGLDVAAPAG
jgi:hypothetical protein